MNNYLVTHPNVTAFLTTLTLLVTPVAVFNLGYLSATYSPYIALTCTVILLFIATFIGVRRVLSVERMDEPLLLPAVLVVVGCILFGGAVAKLAMSGLLQT